MHYPTFGGLIIILVHSQFIAKLKMDWIFNLFCRLVITQCEVEQIENNRAILKLSNMLTNSSHK